MALPKNAPNQYTDGRQMIAGSDINNIASQLNSNTPGITAKAGGGQGAATQLVSATNLISVCATLNDSVKLPKGINGLEVWVQNAGAANAKVYTFGTGTINNIDGVATGVALATDATTATLYKCIGVNAQTGVETWVTK